jgi:amidase
MWADAYPARDAPHVERLRAAGAIPLGHTNLGGPVALRQRAVGATVNPWDRSRTPGGFQRRRRGSAGHRHDPVGGRGDGLGSLRWPAQCCGISVLKPTLGRIPAAATIEPDAPIGAQLMVVEGPIARRVADLRAALAVKAGAQLARPLERAPHYCGAPARQARPGGPCGRPGRPGHRPTGTGWRPEGGPGAGRAGYAVDEIEPRSIVAAAGAGLAMLNNLESVAALENSLGIITPIDPR